MSQMQIPSVYHGNKGILPESIAESLYRIVRMKAAFRNIQKIFYPGLAIFGVPANILAMVILSRRRCGLSRCITRYMLAMAAADLLVLITDLILRHIPIVYSFQFRFLLNLPVCNIHSVLVYAATDLSVWFTVSLTFDRFLAICCSQKVKNKYCTEKTATVVLSTVTSFFCLKDTTWYFLHMKYYLLGNNPSFCAMKTQVSNSRVWGATEIFNVMLTPCVPFVLILLLNALTIRNIFIVSRARARLCSQVTAESLKDPEMESRRKSIILLCVISGNFLLLWALFAFRLISSRLWWLGYNRSTPMYDIPIQEVGYMLQLLSCCTNTMTYALTQSKFREQLKILLKSPFSRTNKLVKR